MLISPDFHWSTLLCSNLGGEGLFIDTSYGLPLLKMNKFIEFTWRPISAFFSLTLDYLNPALNNPALLLERQKGELESYSSLWFTVNVSMCLYGDVLLLRRLIHIIAL